MNSLKIKINNMTSPDFNRVKTTVQHREPDRVPLIDAAISYEIMSKYLGKEVKEENLDLQVEFFTSAGYDYIPLTTGMMQPGKVTMDSSISKAIEKKYQNMIVKQRDDDFWNLEKKSFIKDIHDFEEFPWKHAADFNLNNFYRIQHYLPGNMKIVALSGKIFTLSWLLMGYENFCINLLLDPEFTRKVVDRVGIIQFDALNKVIDIPNVEAIWAVDDLAFGTGTIIDPDSFRKLIFPWYKKFASRCHEKGKLFFFHSDGLLWDVIADLIDLGIDALHPIDPTCMDIREVKKRFGDKICIFGNVPNDMLMSGTREDISEYTKQLIKDLAPGGGYCVASGNSVPEWADIDNYRAMLETTIKYGNYPIRVE